MDLETEIRKTVAKSLVERQIFCPVTGDLLDVRTVGIVVDAEGDPVRVYSPEASKAIRETETALQFLASRNERLLDGEGPVALEEVKHRDHA